MTQSEEENDFDVLLGCESSDFDSDPGEEAVNVKREPRPYDFEPYNSDPDGNADDTEPENDQVDRLTNTTWCSCGQCRAMPTQRECRCCKEISQVSDLLGEMDNCITQHPGFQPVCLDVYVLQTAYYQYRQQYSHGITCENNRRRYTAYRQLARWAWGFLGKDIRVVLPACAVLRIRQEFSSIDEQYTGYLEPQ